MSDGARVVAPALGATPGRGGTDFGVYATEATRVDVRLHGPGGPRDEALTSLGDGRWAARVAGVGPGALYSFVLDGRELPDPYARFLPDGVHGPAEVTSSEFAWRNACVSRPLREHVLYEVHVGAFSGAGTYAGIVERLRDLRDLGITALELLPIAAFAGRRGWGYDGVALYAPHAPYGRPEDLRALVDAAHGLGLAVLLDVVYNHFGPSGNYLAAYSPKYFTSAIATAWGDAPDFTHPGLRRLVVENALYWLREFRFDGLRLDATHALVDPSRRHVLREIADVVGALEPRRLLIAEDERNDPAVVRDLGMDAVWADDFHHQVRVTLTRERDGYYAAFAPGAAGIARAIRRGWLYEGDVYPPTGAPRGAPADDLPAEAFVYCLQNHDQVGNRAFGDRLHHRVPPALWRAVSALLLFLPQTPLLFMGQEWAASSPFLYFTDHEAELGRAVTRGRREEFGRFAAFADPDVAARIPDPQAEATFLASKLAWEERGEGEHARVLALYRAMLALRREDPVLRAAGRGELAAEAHGDVLVVRRWHGGQERVLLVNFGGATALAGLGVDGWRTLLRTGDGDGAVLAGGEAAVLAR